MTTRVAMFGGSFDPIHEGHLETARRATRVFGLEQVLWVPAAQPPHKPDRVLAPETMRLAMLLLATADGPTWEVCDLEFQREGPSYTLHTVEAIPDWLGVDAADLDLHLILGSDNLPGLPTWHRAAELLDRVQPIVAWRDGHPDDHLAAIAGAVADEHLAKLERGFLRLPPIEASSTDLRGRLARGEDCAAWIPPLVLDFIHEKGLYGWPHGDLLSDGPPPDEIDA